MLKGKVFKNIIYIFQGGQKGHYLLMSKYFLLLPQNIFHVGAVSLLVARRRLVRFVMSETSSKLTGPAGPQSGLAPGQLLASKMRVYFIIRVSAAELHAAKRCLFSVVQQRVYVNLQSDQPGKILWARWESVYQMQSEYLPVKSRK